MGEGPDRAKAIRIEDDLTAVNAVRLRELFAGLLAGEGPLVLDLSLVNEMDTAGFQLLAALKHDAAGVGREFMITAHSPATLSVLKLYNMEDHFGLDADTLGILGDAGDDEEPHSLSEGVE